MRSNWVGKEMNDNLSPKQLLFLLTFHQIYVLVYGIVEQKISLWSNWVQDEEDDEFEARDVITHIRLWHDLTDGRTERKVMAASAGAQLHIWNIDKG